LNSDYLQRDVLLYVFFADNCRSCKWTYDTCSWRASTTTKNSDYSGGFFVLLLFGFIVILIHCFSIMRDVIWTTHSTRDQLELTSYVLMGSWSPLTSLISGFIAGLQVNSGERGEW